MDRTTATVGQFYWFNPWFYKGLYYGSDNHFFSGCVFDTPAVQTHQ